MDLEETSGNEVESNARNICQDNQWFKLGTSWLGDKESLSLSHNIWL